MQGSHTRPVTGTDEQGEAVLLEGHRRRIYLGYFVDPDTHPEYGSERFTITETGEELTRVKAGVYQTPHGKVIRIDEAAIALP